MADNVKVPVFGEQNKQTVYVVGGVVVVFLGIAYMRARKAKAAAASAAAASSTQIDPATGYAYGSTEDAQALAGMSAYQNPVSYGGGGGPASNGTTTNPISTNADWTQAAVSYLTNTVQLAPSDVASALGKYIAGDPLNASEKSIVEQAIAGEGMPPVAGPNGYPPNIRDLASPPPTQSGSGSSAAFKIVTQTHDTVAPESGRHLIQRFSAPDAPPVDIEVALQQTVQDPSNQRYRTYYAQHGGMFPPGSIRTHVVVHS